MIAADGEATADDDAFLSRLRPPSLTLPSRSSATRPVDNYRRGYSPTSVTRRRGALRDSGWCTVSREARFPKNLFVQRSICSYLSISRPSRA